MPVDIRNVVFSSEELQAALVNYALRKSIHMPNACIERTGVEMKGELKVQLYFAPAEQKTSGSVVTFTYAQIAAALIMYCLQHNEPLAKMAQKSVIPFDDGVALCLNFPWGDALSPLHPGLKSGIRATLCSVPVN